MGGLACAAFGALACAEPEAPGAQTCAEILSLRVPEAQLVEAWYGVGIVALDYRLDGEDNEVAHRFECALEASAPGRVRARALRLDGRELPEAELVLVNSALLLAEIRRADPGPTRAAARWIDRLASPRPRS